MKRRTLAALTTALFLSAAPMAALAMDHGSMEGMNKGGMDHGKMEGMQNGAMMNGMMMVGTQTEDGVQAMAHMKDIHEAMSKMGMDQTHHFMVMFTDAKTGKPITDGAAAVKITGPDGKTGEPVKLMQMEDGFGSDVALPQKGEYTFDVGTKLADGQKRTFEFKQNVK